MTGDTQGLETVVDFVRWGASRFREAGLHFGHGTDNPVDESLQLVMHALHLDYPLPEDFHAARLTSTERADVLGLLQRRIEERKPAAYLTGQAWFAGMVFDVNEHVLVPRSPIAELVEQAFAPWSDPEAVGNILDLCTGSGCIAVACAVRYPDAHVDAVDISGEALEVARRNVERYNMAGRVRLLTSDLFESLDGMRYDIIVSNPPYVPRAEFESLPPEFGHEPELGLVAGEDGLDVVRRILSDARRHLTDTGILVVEVGTATAALSAAFPSAPFTWPTFSRGGGGVFILTAAELESLTGGPCVPEGEG